MALPPLRHPLRIDKTPGLSQDRVHKLKDYTHQKLNIHKLNNENAEKIVINRSEYSCNLHYRTLKAKAYVIY